MPEAHVLLPCSLHLQVDQLTVLQALRIGC